MLFLLRAQYDRGSLLRNLAFEYKFAFEYSSLDCLLNKDQYLIEHRALLIEHRALLIEHRALLIETQGSFD